MEYLKAFFQGLVMGVAEGVPGVSGSTLALLMGIYEKFISLLHSVSEVLKILGLALIRRREFLDVRKSWNEVDLNFAIPLALGTVIALIGFAVVIDLGLEHYPMQVYGVFFGLTIASVSIPLRKVGWTRGLVLQAIISMVVALTVIAFLQNNTFVGSSFTPLYIFVAGALAISGMLFPGVSGSFILLILGLYSYIYTGTVRSLLSGGVSTQQLIDLGIFVLGLVTGFLVLVKLLKLALSKYKDSLLAIILGIMVGASKVLWPFMELREEPSLVHLNPKLMPWEVEASALITVIGVIIIFAVGGIWVSSRNKDI